MHKLLAIVGLFVVSAATVAAQPLPPVPGDPAPVSAGEDVVFGPAAPTPDDPAGDGAEPIEPVVTDVLGNPVLDVPLEEVITEEPLSALVPSGASLPELSPDTAVECLTDRDGHRWRVQCTDDAKGKVCRYAPEALIGTDGKWGGPIERTVECSRFGGFNRARLIAEGWTLERAIADAPKGWKRDERGRVFQVEFDLHNRIYVGVDWTPGKQSDTGFDGKGLGLSFGGVEFEVFREQGVNATRTRVQLLRGDVALAPFAADLTAIRIDMSRRREAPLLHLTTFFGTPRRFDIDAHLGAWLEVGRLTVRETSDGTSESLYRFGTANLTWDIWRTYDMYSFVRVRGGAGIERTNTNGNYDSERDAVTPGAAVEGNFTFDPKGLNHLTVLASWEHPLAIHRTLSGGLGNRIHAGVGFERIVVALNDQPITVRVAAETDYRSDLPDRAKGWDVRGLIGLRFNFWAPAR